MSPQANTMPLLILAACLSVCSASYCPEQCTCEVIVSTYSHALHCSKRLQASFDFNAWNNATKTQCKNTNFTCADLLSVNQNYGAVLSIIQITGCSPSILKCMEAPSVFTIRLKESIAPLEGEHVAGLKNVKYLKINKGSETRIPSSVIAALPKLLELYITDTPITLQANDFLNASQIEYLELFIGPVGGIPEDAFRGLTNLRSLTIKIKDGRNEIYVNSFRGLDSLQRLFLSSNSITSIPAGALVHVPRLRELWMLNNQLQELPPGLLYNLTHLETVLIRQPLDSPLKLHKHSLANLPSLTDLKIYGCCSNLPEELFTGCDEIEELNILGNNITSLPAGFFKDLKKLETLNLKRNRIAKLDPGVFLPLKQLRRLYLDNNNLEELPDHLFFGLSKLEHVSMDDNLLQNISSKAFSGAIHLTTVSLKDNRLTLKPQYQLAGGYENFEDYSQFGVLEELQNLYLSGNQISTMFSDWAMVLNKLQKLDLSNNSFTILDATDLQFSSPHVVVDLTHNHISRVRLPYPSLHIGDPKYEMYESTNSILLDDNPLNCDCGLYNLAMRLKGAKSMTAEPKFVLDNATCASPTHLQGKLFKNWLKMPYDLNCDLPAEQRDQNCLSCQIRTASNELAFHCNNIPKNMSEDNYFKKVSKEFGLKHVSLRLNEPPQSLKNLNLKLLNLSGIALKEIPFSPSLNVQTIDFSNNNLTKIPMEFLEANISLYLSNNKFQCDCWNSEELSYLKSSKNVLDLGLVKCGDKLLSAMEPLDLCLTKWRAAAVAGGIFAVLVLIVAILAVVIYKNSYKIMVFIINRGLCTCCFVDDLDDMNKEFDVFVSYAHKDRKYLETLMPKLENDFGLKTCVHHRDWLVGDFIPDQINRSVEKSKKTIIMLSKNFLDSAYANMEFRAAHNLALREGKSRIVLILLEDVANHEKLSEDLKSHMKMNTFLKWDDARFNEKLQRAMPLKNNKKFVFPRFFKEAGCKTVKSDVDVHFNNDEELVNVVTKDAM